MTIAGKTTGTNKDLDITVTCSSDEYSDSRESDEETDTYLEKALESSVFTIKKKTSGGTTGTGSSRPNISTSGTAAVPQKNVAAPRTNIENGTVLYGTCITISCNDTSAKIYYTTDGSAPSESSFIYTNPINIYEDTSLRYMAVVNGNKSTIQNSVYTVRAPKITLRANAGEIRFMLSEDSNRFNPDRAITRYEVLDALNRLFEIEKTDINSEFSDVDAEHKQLVDLFYGAGIVEGYPDNTFGGEKQITRAEFVKILSDMLGLTIENDADYSDITGHWAEKSIRLFSKHINGYPDGTFRPDGNITRAEALVLLDRLAGGISDDTRLNQLVYSDTSGHWACDAIGRRVLQ